MSDFEEFKEKIKKEKVPDDVWIEVLWKVDKILTILEAPIAVFKSPSEIGELEPGKFTPVKKIY